MAALSTLALAAVAGSTAVGLYAADTQAREAKKSRNAAADAARKTEKAADEATNRANQKTPDTAALLESASLTGKAGNTLLNGPQGVDPNALLLGKNTLLGQ
jgi:hypothetical protein